MLLNGLRANSLRALVRYASSKRSAKAKVIKQQQQQQKPAASPRSRAPEPSSSNGSVTTTSNASASTSSQPFSSPVASTSAAGALKSEPEGGEHYVREKVIYRMKDTERVMSVRLLWGLGFMIFALLTNAADMIRREPRQPTDPDAPRIESWPAWKRYGIAGLIFGSGAAMAAYAVYWPTRILKSIKLIAPSSPSASGTSTTHQILLPNKRLMRGQSILTPYHACNVECTTAASELAPWIFKSPIVPFSKLQLLGPLSSSPKWYHPRNSAAFGEKASKNGRYPSNVPLQIKDSRVLYNLRKAGGEFEDLEGLERALLMNDPKTRLEVPPALRPYVNPQA